MPTELFADNAATTLTSSPSAGGTSFTVTSSTGFPAAVTGVSQFRVIIGTEIVTVTNVSGTTWTCTALAGGHTSGDAVTHVVTAAGLRNLPAPPWSPSLNGLLAATQDPVLMNGANAIGASTAYLTKIQLPVGLSVTNILVKIGTAGATLTANRCYAGLYDNSGTRLGVTADQSAAWVSAGLKTMAISGGPISTTAPWGWVALMYAGTTSPTFSGTYVTIGNTDGNLSLSGATLRGATTGSSLTALPTSFTPSGIAANGAAAATWAGLS